VKARSFDYVLISIVIALVLFGLVMVFSASYYTSQSSGGSGQFYFQKQLMGAAIGFIAMIFFSLIDYHLYQKISFIFAMIIVSTIMLVAVFFTKEDVNGAKRWIDLGFVSFQPSEVARLSFLFLAASLFSANFKLIRSSKISLFFRGSWPVIAVLLLYWRCRNSDRAVASTKISYIFKSVEGSCGYRLSTYSILICTWFRRSHRGRAW
jgi:cell division protein FtsW